MTTIKGEIITLAAKLDAKDKDRLAALVKNCAASAAINLMQVIRTTDVEIDEVLGEAQVFCEYMNVVLELVLEGKRVYGKESGEFVSLLSFDA